MKLTGEWIHEPGTQGVMTMLHRAGYGAFFVGGCVRNEVLGAPVKDIDIATDALPEEVLKLAEKSDLKAVPTGLDHGTITIIAEHIPHEITTFREDVKSHGRHADVSFSADIRQDARRRDFTMNALYATQTGEVIDPLGGLPDLQAGRVRFIEDPSQRIQEDYLRILRFFRFHAWYGDPESGMDADALAAIASSLDGLSHLSHERVGSEILKLLSAPDPAPSLAAMQRTGVLGRVLPGADDRFVAIVVHLESEFSLSADPIRRLASLGGEGSRDRLRLSNQASRDLEIYRTEMDSETTAIELGYRYGPDTGLSILLLRAAISETPLLRQEADKVLLGANSKFPVSAKDLMPNWSGPLLGKRLQQLETIWLKSGCQMSRDSLLDTKSDDC